MKKIFCILYFTFLYSNINAQSGVSEANLANPVSKEIEFNGVNGATGLANISIPIYNLKLGELNIPIELKYNSSGIKVEQFASEVGLGWIINTGGYVEKEIVGEHDYPNSWGSYKDSNGNYVQAEDNMGYQIGTSKIYEAPDIYQIYAPTLNNSFYIDKSFSVVPIAPYNGAKISIQYGRDSEDEAKKYGHSVFYQSDPTRYVCGMSRLPVYIMGSFVPSPGSTGCPFQLKTFNDTQKISVVNGHFTFEFNDSEYSAEANHKDMIYNDVFNENHIRVAQSKHHSKYWLSKITDNLTQKGLNFKYETFAGASSYTKKGGIWNVLLYVTQSNMNIRNFVADNVQFSIKKLVKEINTDNEKLIFNYSYERDDKKYLDITYNSVTNWQMVKEPLLKSIQVEDLHGIIKYVFIFTYDYFNSGCTDNENCYRLKLKNITKYAGNYTGKVIDKFDLEYYEDASQPKISSFAKDIFGFNNGLSDNELSDNGLPKRHFLYQYKEVQNGIEYPYFSTLKFAHLSPTLIGGNYDQILSDFVHTRAWSLKSIQYLTKGKQQFEYEINQFDWKGVSYQGGGQRIKKISFLDGAISYDTKYSYQNGNLVTLPQVTDLQQAYAGNRIINQLTDSNVTYFQGSPIIYDEVTITQPNGGKITSKYTSVKDFPYAYSTTDSNNNPVIMQRYYYANGDFTWKYRFKKEFIGLPLNTTYYNSEGIKIKDVNYTYSNEIKDYPTTYPLIKGERFFGSYFPFTRYYNATIGYTLPDMTVNKRLRNNLIEKNTTLYYKSGNISTKDQYNYLDDSNLLKSIITTEGNISYKTENLYAFEQGQQYDSQIAADEKVNQIIVGKNKFKNSNKVFEGLIKYKSIPNQNDPTKKQLLPNKIINLIPEDNIYEDKLEYTLYDSKGNSIETKNSAGIYTTIIYGYGQTLPIAKIEGIRYQDVMSAINLFPNTDPNIYIQSEIVKKSDLDVGSSTEQDLLNALNTFRNNIILKGYNVTTYTYDPLIGLKSITPPSGIKESYQYNTSSKLEKVLNSNDEIVEEYKYNYIP
jgi:hypothetical protein